MSVCEAGAQPGRAGSLARLARIPKCPPGLLSGAHPDIWYRS